MEFKFETYITKEVLLKAHSQETYLEHYLGIPVKKGLFVNPLRNDKNPTASFYQNKNGDIIFKDFGTSFSGNFITVVMEKFNCNYRSALLKIAEDFDLKGKSLDFKEVKKNESHFVYNGVSNIQVQIQDFSKSELKWWKQYGITESILKKYNVYSCKHVFLNGRITSESTEDFPIFGYYMGTDDKELWRIYYPRRTSYRFLSNTSSNKIQGLAQLPTRGKLLVITKSMKDVMCLRSFGIYAIAPNSENLFINDEVLEDLKKKFKKIVVFYDNDLAGISNMNKIRKKHPELYYFYIKRSYNAKDISDFVKMYGKSETKEFIKYQLYKLKT